MIDIRNYDLYLRYYNEARKVFPPRWEEKLELYLDHAALNPIEKNLVDRTTFETSFSAYSGMKLQV